MALDMDDIEKQASPQNTRVDPTGSDSSTAQHEIIMEDDGGARVEAIRQANPVLRVLADWERRIDKLLRFEAQGVERVPEDQRKPPQILNVSKPQPPSPLLLRTPCRDAQPPPPPPPLLCLSS